MSVLNKTPNPTFFLLHVFFDFLPTTTKSLTILSHPINGQSIPSALVLKDHHPLTKEYNYCSQEAQTKLQANIQFKAKKPVQLKRQSLLLHNKHWTFIFFFVKALKTKRLCYDKDHTQRQWKNIFTAACVSFKKQNVAKILSCNNYHVQSIILLSMQYLFPIHLLKHSHGRTFDQTYISTHQVCDPLELHTTNYPPVDITLLREWNVFTRPQTEMINNSSSSLHPWKLINTLPLPKAGSRQLE